MHSAIACLVTLPICKKFGNWSIWVRLQTARRCWWSNEVKHNEDFFAWESTNTVQVWKECKSKCMHLLYEQYTLLSVLQLQSWNIPKFFELILFILRFYVRFIWLHELLFSNQNSAKDILVSLSSLSSIPTSNNCNFFQRHFYTLRLKLFLIRINFAIEL